MTDIENFTAVDLMDRTVVDPDGDKIGKVFDLYLDDQTGQPEWLAVSTGLFGTRVSFVPITGAALVDDGDVMVAHSKDMVKDAPNAEADGQLSVDEEAQLYTHYGYASDTSAPPAAGGPVDGADGYDTSGPTTDDAMTRSEEEVDVSTHSRVAGRARLRKWIETEDVHMTVPIRREKARVVVEPITDANRDDAYAGGDLTTEEHEITLSEEVVDIDKRVVAKERVRLETDVETDEVVVDEEVRKERVEMDHDATTVDIDPDDPTGR